MATFRDMIFASDKHKQPVSEIIIVIVIKENCVWHYCVSYWVIVRK